MQLIELGWNSFFENNFELYKESFVPLRITREDRGKYLALGEMGEVICEVSGKFTFEANGKASFPTVGDWVAATALPNESKAIIHAVLPRKTVFSRKVVGEITEEQPVASNVDIVFIVTGLDLNFNLRRIERFLAMTWNSGAIPVVLLNKADLCDDVELRQNEVAGVAIGVDIHTLSATSKTGMEIFAKYIQKGKTTAFLGSSGVGKSTIVNSLLGSAQLKVGEVSELGSRGRHTTTSRELILLPNGGMVIDTPGMRELQVWGEEDGLSNTFQDIEQFADSCRFKDCTHQNEPGCAVQEAIQNGSLSLDRLESYLKLKREFAYLSDRQTMKASAIEKARWKSVSKLLKNKKKESF